MKHKSYFSEIVIITSSRFGSHQCSTYKFGMETNNHMHSWVLRGFNFRSGSACPQVSQLLALDYALDCITTRLSIESTKAMFKMYLQKYLRIGLGCPSCVLV